MPSTITARHPHPDPSELVAALTVPPRFQGVRFDNYIPDPQYPSQRQALEAVRDFAHALKPHQRRGRLFRRARPATTGLYLDGGFGVGKTHLLTSLYHVSPGRAVYGTFVEYTNLVGVLGYQRAVHEFSSLSLMCIDEFELDDVGDTLLMTRLLRELSDAGVAIAATSNTPPRALGEGRFAAQDFLREITSMAERFTIIRIDGDDYRHRDTLSEPPRLDEHSIAAWARDRDEATTVDSWPEVRRHLVTVHPSRYGALTEGLRAVCITGMTTVTDHRDALRLVVFVDRLYDRDIPLVCSGTPIAGIFTEELLGSGYAKKYQRCLSRIGALASEGARLVAHAT